MKTSAPVDDKKEMRISPLLKERIYFFGTATKENLFCHFYLPFTKGSNGLRYPLETAGLDNCLDLRTARFKSGARFVGRN